MSRIFAPVDTFPLPTEQQMIDVKLDCGSLLINANLTFDLISGKPVIMWIDHYVDVDSITFWRESQDFLIDWPTESEFRYGSDL